MSHSTLSLPTVRAHQLRRLAEDIDWCAVDLLDGYIQGAWEWAGYGLDLPPFDFSVGRDDETGEARVYFSAPGTHILDFSADQAHAVARGITTLLDGTAPRFVTSAQCGGDPGGLVGERRGRGYVLKVAGDLDGTPRAAVVSLTKSVAADLARIFEDRAAKAQALNQRVAV